MYCYSQNSFHSTCLQRFHVYSAPHSDPRSSALNQTPHGRTLQRPRVSLWSPDSLVVVEAVGESPYPRAASAAGNPARSGTPPGTHLCSQNRPGRRQQEGVRSGDPRLWQTCHGITSRLGYEPGVRHSARRHRNESPHEGVRDRLAHDCQRAYERRGPQWKACGRLPRPGKASLEGLTPRSQTKRRLASDCRVPAEGLCEIFRRRIFVRRGHRRWLHDARL
mmetsp:Transcript_22137/g.30414  ORF Transcript_22137/g.30414 Transcript_22137/m.30414 type:complete len:221 (-) Transcript_22137:509-1171(-)